MSAEDDHLNQFEVPDDTRGPRIADFLIESNNATHIQQVALALLDAGFGVETVWQEDGAWLTLYWDDAVVEG